MATRLNRTGYDNAKRMFSDEQFVYDNRPEWSKYKPTRRQENEYLKSHGYREYSHWFLAIDNSKPVHTKDHFKFPYSDFKKLHRCAVLSIESRAGQYKYRDIQQAAAHLHGMPDGVRQDNFVQPQYY